jgi:hypothetical protein
MPNRLDLPSRRFGAAAAGVVLTVCCPLIACESANASAASGNGATWSGNASASSIAATLFVSAIDCAGLPKGTYEGQQSGVELFGRYTSSGSSVYPADFAGVYSYCRGKIAVYTPQFVVADTASGKLTFKRADFRTSPGDPLNVSIRAADGGETLTITDGNTKASDSVHGPGLGTGFGWAAGMTPIDTAADGAPETSGSLRIFDEYAPSLIPIRLAGPVASPPVVLTGTTVDGGRISHASNGVYASVWKRKSGQRLASVTSAAAGNFSARLAQVATPRLSRTADLTRVRGNVTYELPGTHRFVHLGNVTTVPDSTVINADDGSVQITLALPGGSSQTGIFHSGEFALDQRRSGATTARLAGGSYGGCPADSAAQPRATAAGVKAKKRRKTKVRGLWANAHGSFTTKGSYGAAAVLGTRWFTEDRCDGTYFHVSRDKIKVTSYYPRRHRVLVPQGHSYLAPAVYPAPNGTITDNRLGSIRLAQTRAAALADYRFGTSRGFGHKYYFRLSEGGVRIGFASPQLLQTLPAALQSQLRDRVVWASTWSSYYAIDRIHVHATLAALQRALPGGQLVTVGSNDWYLAPFGSATAVFKIDDGTVRELGITLASLTGSRSADQALMSSFDT